MRTNRKHANNSKMTMMLKKGFLCKELNWLPKEEIQLSIKSLEVAYLNSEIRKSYKLIQMLQTRITIRHQKLQG